MLWYLPLAILAIALQANAAAEYNPPHPDPERPLSKLPNARPRRQERKFVSQLVEEEIVRVSEKIKDSALRRIWQK